MKRISIIFLVLLISCSGKNKKSSSNIDSVDANISSDGWVSLFDGESFHGWHNYRKDSISEEWQVVDGAMHLKPDPDRIHGINNLITDKKYTNFILSIEWKISKKGNSGVFWGVFEDEKYPVPYQTGPEIQILDNLNHSDNSKKIHMTGALFGLVGVEKDRMNEFGEWNHFLITIDHRTNRGSVQLNGSEIISFPLQGDEWESLVKNSKFKEWKGFGKYPNGHIGLQDHASEVSFRNIKIKEI